MGKMGVRYEKIEEDLSEMKADIFAFREEVKALTPKFDLRFDTFRISFEKRINKIESRLAFFMGGLAVLQIILTFILK
jgi:hypothetical protein